MEFRIPDLPQSVNSLYKINYGHRVVYLSNEARAYKNLVKMCMPPVEFPEGSKFHLSVEFGSQWHYKNGKNKRADVQNLIKLLIDGIFERLGIDDSYLYSLTAKKVESKDKYTLVRLEPL